MVLAKNIFIKYDVGILAIVPVMITIMQFVVWLFHFPESDAKFKLFS